MKLDARLKRLAIICLAFVAVAAFAKVRVPEQAENTDSPRTVTIETDLNVSYSVSVIKAKAGETIRIVFKNTALKTETDVPHNIAFLRQELSAEELDAMMTNDDGSAGFTSKLREICFAATPNVGPEENWEMHLPVPFEKGSYTFFCYIPDHAFLGMRGVLVVE